jgi:hypothetical protein
LNELQEEDADCIVFARRIQRLGFDSQRILRNHFKQYGKVEKVLLSNAHQHSEHTDSSLRLRPSGLALILMANRDSAAAILAEGDVQRVQGVDVQIRRFERRSETKDDGISDDDGTHDERTPSLSSDPTRHQSDHADVAKGNRCDRCDTGSTRCSDSDS